jgi:hypothetical protein
MAICRALLKYGHSNFSEKILEYCVEDKDIILSKEQYYLDQLKPEYNTLKTAGSPLGFKLSEKTKAQMSEAKKGKNNPMFGKNHSDESKKKITDAMPNKIQIEVTDIKNNTTTTYNCIREAARALNIAQPTINSYFSRNQKKPYKGRFIFTKIDVGN